MENIKKYPRKQTRKYERRPRKTYPRPRFQLVAPQSRSLRQTFPFVVDELPGRDRNIQYEVLSLLGNGRWGTVFQARIISPQYQNRLVALKVRRNSDDVRIVSESLARSLIIRNRTMTNCGYNQPFTTLIPLTFITTSCVMG